MVTFRLIEETGQYLTYWYFPNGNEDEMYGIILIDKLNETVEIQKMAHDDFSHIVTVDEQNELRNSINERRRTSTFNRRRMAFSNNCAYKNFFCRSCYQ